MQTASRTLESLIDDALLELRDLSEREASVQTSDGLANATDTSFTAANGDEQYVNATDVIEYGQELMLVTDVTGTGVTVSRGYLGTTANSSVAANELFTVNPRWPRHKIAAGVQKGVNRLDAWVPLVQHTTLTVGATSRLLALPQYTSDVLDVRRETNDTLDRWQPIGGWWFEGDLDATDVANGVGLMVSREAIQNDRLRVTYRLPYRWSTEPPTAESDTIDLPFSGQDLPAMYAVAWMLSGREVSRESLDRAEEWSMEVAARQGYSLRLVRDKWQDFYRTVDEVKRTLPDRPKRRHFRKMPRSYT